MITAQVHALFSWLGDSSLGHFMRNYAQPSSIAVVLHLFGLVLVGGPSLLVSLAVLRTNGRTPSATRMNQELWPLYLAGLVLTTLTGVALVAGKADYYFENTVFWLKIGLLVPAALITLLLHRHLAGVGQNTIRLRWRLVSGTNLLLWTGVAVTGRGIGLF